jgi:very-short-patch-repair endonuclease
VVHRTLHLPADDLRRIERIVVTSPARTLCDLAARLRPPQLRHVVETQLLARSPTSDELVACFESWAGRGVPGAAAMRAVLDEILDDQPVPESRLELLAVERLRSFGIVGARRQFRPPWFDGRRGAVDFAWPDARVILEVDGRAFHLATQSKDADEQRDLLAAEHDWLVVRVGWRTLRDRPSTFLARLAAILANRSLMHSVGRAA